MAVVFNTSVFVPEYKMSLLYYNENYDNQEKSVLISQNISPDGKLRTAHVGDCANFGNLADARFKLRIKKIK